MPPEGLRSGSRVENKPKNLPKGGPRGTKNESKITLLGVPGHWCGTKGPQGLSGYPPRPKMEPKWCQNGTKNGATTLITRSAVPLSSDEIREKLAYIPGSAEERELAYIPNSAEERERERERWHTTRASPRREMQQPPKLSHAPACRGGMGEANLNCLSTIFTAGKAKGKLP